MPPIISIANQKGGVGKTSTTLGLAAAIANTDRRVLIVDMDPQSNASSTLLPDYDELRKSEDFFTSNDLLEAGVDPSDVQEAILGTPWPGVDLIPAQQALANRDLEGSTGIEMRLRRVLRGLDDLPKPYDVVLIDCPPSVGRLTVNALLASQSIVFIAEPDRYSSNALDQIQATLQTVREVYEHDIEVSGLVINMYENTNEANQRTEELKARFDDEVLLVMPKRTVIAAAAGMNTSVFAVKGRQDAREVADMYTALARRLKLIGRREATPLPIEVDEDSPAAAVGY